MTTSMSKKLRAIICLVLSVAFLFACSVFSAGALAAPGDASFTGSPSIEGNELRVPLDITPLTPSLDGAWNATIHFRRGGVDFGVGTLVTGIVYETLVTVDKLVYTGIPAGFNPFGITRGSDSSISVGAGNVINVVVYIDEASTDDGDDDDGGGGGGGGGTVVVPISTPTTSGTDTGWQSYDPASDTATVYIDPEKTEDLFTAPPPTGVVLVDAPTVPGTDGSLDAVPENVTASIPLEVVTQAASVNVPSILNLGAIEIELPPAVMHSLAQSVQTMAGGLGSLRIKVNGSTQQESNTTLAGLDDVDRTGMTTASQVITLSFVVADPQGRETKVSVDKASLSVGFNPALVRSPSKVNLYIIGSLIYAGGKVDVINNTVTADVLKTQGGRFVALEYDKSFVDIGGHWAQRDIELMASKYVVKGMTDTEFWPNTPVNRAQFVTLLVRSLGLSEVLPATPTFKDVSKDTWYYGFVEAAHKAGLATGDGGAGGSFRPTDSVSREEMAVLLTRALNINGTPLPSVALADLEGVLNRFPDGTAISSWARTELAQAVNAGIMRGRDNGSFDPRGRGTRAEAATLMSRLAKQAGLI